MIYKIFSKACSEFNNNFQSLNIDFYNEYSEFENTEVFNDLDSMCAQVYRMSSNYVHEYNIEEHDYLLECMNIMTHCFEKLGDIEDRNSKEYKIYNSIYDLTKEFINDIDKYIV